ncbi:hypothetical protein HH212_24965 [Massilia forsythiae]|uniref:DUF4124 domain-containing protein n=2 Tax=Massilia forsythiae TaxID=2728020 RepID=A0A7Z2W2I8_9BURK|nr:hypothetical protein HH212_24965 [Massilia forsythiae]
MKTTPRWLVAVALAIPLLADAAPAPWFQWRSLADGSLVCSQTPLGPGWEKSSGPYRDAHCEKRMSAK